MGFLFNFRNNANYFRGDSASLFVQSGFPVAKNPWTASLEGVL